MKKTHTKVYTNALIRKITWIYGVVLILMGLLASYMAYDKESVAMVSQLEQTMSELNYAYENTTEDFWRLYMPIFTGSDDTYTALRKYFMAEDQNALTPVEKRELMEAMQTIMAFNHGVSWMGVYTGKDSPNYYLLEGDSILREMSSSFPFVEEMEKKGAAMEVYGSKTLQAHNGQILTFALCGNASMNVKDGKIIFGYTTDTISSANVQTADIENARFYITNEHGVVYDSSGLYDRQILTITERSGAVFRQDGQLMKIFRLKADGRQQVFCLIPWRDAVLQGHTFSPYILAIVVLFLVCSLLIYRWTGRNIMGKINVIQTGLHKIGENELDHRIPVPKDPKDEFENIGRSINDMTARLQENINKTYELKLKQKETELSELQAKFDPHFLYNTLEVIRGKVYENGDMETSDVIIRMAQLFRNLIGSENFVTIRDEIDFCNSYLSLMEYRYDDGIDIIYDIESDVMQYGIIRNLLQPVLENFFVHGIDEEKWKHTLKIRGKIYDEEYIWFYIQDDGLGIPEGKLEPLMRSLETAGGSAQSYGLRNVQRRIKLFYGPDCGLVLKNNELGGVTVEIKIKRLTLKDHEVRLYEG